MCFYNMHAYTCFLIQVQEPKNCHQITWEVVMTHDVQEGEFSFLSNSSYEAHTTLFVNASTRGTYCISYCIADVV